MELQSHSYYPKKALEKKNGKLLQNVVYFLKYKIQDYCQFI